MRKSGAPPFTRKLLYPQHWPMWLGIGLLRLLAFLPLAWLVKLGEGVGWLAGKLARERRHIVRVNLRLCFPGMGEGALEQLANEHFKALGAALFEMPFGIWASDERFGPHAQAVGVENLRAARADGSGVLLLTGHFTTQEVGGRAVALAAQQPLHAMYRPIKNPVVDYCMHHWRERHARAAALPRDDLRAIVRALRDGGVVWYAPDQALNERVSVIAPFFGVPVHTVSAASRLAQMGRAKVVPYFPVRKGDRYEVRFLPALEGFPSGDELADTTRLNAIIEDAVRANPAQYFWVHRRFKKQRLTGSDPYATGR